jgi:iron complex outermembrane receptor protein
MIKTFQRTTLIFMFLSVSLISIGQSVIIGTVTDEEGNSLLGASILIEELNTSTQSDEGGKYEISVENADIYHVIISYLGRKTIRKEVILDKTPIDLNIQMTPDPLEIGSVIVTGTFNEKSRLASSIASSTLSEKNIKNSAALGTAELLGNVTGTFVDASAGSIFTRVYSRGISSSAEEDIGWYYMSLQEDGLPITNYHTTYYGPDLFHRADLTTRRLEAVRGGSAMITSTNAPGGVFNFISKTGSDQFGAEVLVTGGLQGDNNLLARYDVNVGGPISDNGLNYNIGGFYRYDQGARNTDINWENGGQLKANISKRTKKESGFGCNKLVKSAACVWTGL